VDVRFNGEVVTKHLVRPEGVCIKHRLNRNTLKSKIRLGGMYDKQGSDKLAKPVVTKKSRSRGLTPLTGIDSPLITILLRGEFALNGFRNRDPPVADELLFPTTNATTSDSTSPNTATSDSNATALAERRRQSGQVTRLLRLFRAPGLIQKILHTHRSQLTATGRRILPTFPAARAASTQALSQIAA
jgi:hypothetical protein